MPASSRPPHASEPLLLPHEHPVIVLYEVVSPEDSWVAEAAVSETLGRQKGLGDADIVTTRNIAQIYQPVSPGEGR